MPLLEIGMVLGGLVLLFVGAEGLVKGASAMALRLGITPIIVGLTVIAFGTSAPELLVGLIGTDDVAVGNILGSNVANLALILGAAALVHPIEVKHRAVRHDLPIMIGVTVLFILLAINGSLSQLNGGILLGTLVAYLGYTYYEARRDALSVEDVIGEELDDEEEAAKRSPLANLAFILGGIIGLALGAKWMVDGSIAIAQMIGVSELVIGISVVALGTSLPELATSMSAARHGETDLTVGNVIGSNIFNLLLVLGVVSSVGAVTVDPQALAIDLWVVLGLSVLIWPLLRSDHCLDRKEGVFLLVVYAVYVITLFIR